MVSLSLFPSTLTEREGFELWLNEVAESASDRIF